jgi:hypothetical protein
MTSAGVSLAGFTAMALDSWRLRFFGASLLPSLRPAYDTLEDIDLIDMNAGDAFLLTN